MTPAVVIIGGPTAVGKTAVALQLARRLPFEIICADSLTVYQGFDIGSAKPDQAERAVAPHHLLDIRTADQPFSASDFLAAAQEAIAGITARGALPLVVGGTGLYLHTLLHGLSQAPGEHPVIRQTLYQRLATEGAAHLHRQLHELDPVLAPRIEPQHTSRLIRALEVVLATGKPLSTYHAEQRATPPPFTSRLYCLTRPREELYQRVDARVDQMLAAGLLAEVRQLLERGVAPSTKPMQSIGYAECCQHLREGVPWDQTVQAIKQHTRNLAKRQLTWFRREPACHWLTLPTDAENLYRDVQDFLQTNETP
ncbi:MAG: tRNA (adenosine(37)-N6)-dimethylallyltransferase MiaA [Trichlorobacter sp.]